MYHYFSQTLTAQSGDPPLEEQNISGALSGNYPRKRYFVTGDCTIASGVDVAFAAGCEILFDGDYKFEVIGQIQLNGTAVRRILVAPSAANVNERWRGFLLCDDVDFFNFTNGEDGTDNKFTFVDFVKAEKLQESGANYHRIRGAAIFAYLYENITIEDCTFTDCAGLDYGGTVYLHVETGGSTSFKRNSFVRCSAQNDASGAWVFTHGTFLVEDCSYEDCTGGFGEDFGYSVDVSSNLFSTGTHYQITGNIVKFKTNANAPAPCVAGVEYFAIIVSGSTFRLAASLADAFAGTAIDITAGPSGSAIMNILQEYNAFDATVTITD